MRYEKGHRDATRKHIIETASRLFREQGIDSLSVANLMTAAGLTHGGFYSHFSSKEDLVQAAISAALDETLAWLSENAGDDIEDVIDIYLAPLHRERRDLGCVFACLAGEIVRRPEETVAVFHEKLDEYIDFFAGYLPVSVAKKERRDVAGQVLSIMIGALQLSRLCDDVKAADKVLANGKAAALRLVK